MRPAGEVRQALLNAALALSTPERSPTLRELAIYAQVGFEAARRTVDNMSRAGDLQVPRWRRVDYRNKPVAEYCPASVSEPDDLLAVFGCWAAGSASSLQPAAA